MIVGADDRDVFFAAVDVDAVVIGHHAGGGYDSRTQLLADCFDVGHLVDFDEVLTLNE